MERGSHHFYSILNIDKSQEVPIIVLTLELNRIDGILEDSEISVILA